MLFRSLDTDTGKTVMDFALLIISILISAIISVFLLFNLFKVQGYMNKILGMDLVGSEIGGEDMTRKFQNAGTHGAFKGML